MSKTQDYVATLVDAIKRVRNTPPEIGEEQPLRVEMLSCEQLERHAQALASWHQVDFSGGPDRLLTRLNQNAAIIHSAYKIGTEPLPEHGRTLPAENWLLDNYHLIDAQIRTAKVHLPRNYSRQLPRLMNGPMADSPRVYDIALELISHVDGFIDKENLHRFVTAYQQADPLLIGELWALPIMLRLALIENLRRVSARLTWQRRHQQLAEHWASRLLKTSQDTPDQLIIELAEMVKAQPPLSAAFVPHFARRLQGRSPALAHALNWVEQQLNEQGQNTQQLIDAASQSEAADQIAMGNSITSLRSLGSMRWPAFVEEMSVVDGILRDDPQDLFAKMDFGTRDRCRHVIEYLARNSSRTEAQVATQTMQLAAPPPESPGVTEPDHRLQHPAYYLIDRGVAQLRLAIEYRLCIRERLNRFVAAAPLHAYLGAVGAVAISATIIVMAAAYTAGIQGFFTQLIGTILVVLGASRLSIGLVNLVATRLVTPKPLPKMDFDNAIPDDHAALVVIPTLIDSEQTVDSLVDHIEVCYLANRDDNLRFVLLTDMPDADSEVLPTDDAITKRMKVAIENLNQRYAPDGVNRFAWLHRPRQYNTQEQKWMAWERKRGKLTQLNRLVLDGDAEPFIHAVGDINALRKARYVVTLDTDTQLPHGVARQLVATLAHPLNQPQVDHRTRRVTDGYAIIQPRVSNGLAGANSSPYAKLNSGDAGIDPYTREVSDVYQDLFAEGSFIGKGIYHIQAFESTLGERFPDNWILSHDLIESVYARSALASDIELVEDYPPSYLADVSRRHRWIRGDWQIAPWLLPKAPNAKRRWASNPVSSLARWKIFDNLRRSFMAPALMAALLLALIAAPQTAGFFTFTLIVFLALPAAVSSLLGLINKSTQISLSLHLANVTTDTARHAATVALDLAFLPNEAITNLDAIARSLWRMAVSRKNLLEWRVSSDAQRSARKDALGYYRAMWIGPAAALALPVLTGFSLNALPALAPLMLLWILSPFIGWRISQPLAAANEQLTKPQHAYLRRIARLTWRYFEVFVNEADNHLPPDNVQELPRFEVDSRTSPTNIGMGLLANLSAYDFGYIPTAELIERTENTFASLDQLERYRGHFYNWYDTKTLATLQPFYVSAVDSGNLVGHLLTLQAGLIALPNDPLLPNQTFRGLADTFRIFHDVAFGFWDGIVDDIDQAASNAKPTLQEITSQLPDLKTKLTSPPKSLRQRALCLQQITEQAQKLLAIADEKAADNNELRAWAQAFYNQAQDTLDDLQGMAPWLNQPPPPSTECLALPDDLKELISQIDSDITLQQAACLAHDFTPLINRILETNQPQSEAPGSTLSDEWALWLTDLRANLAPAEDRALQRITTLNQLAERAEEFADADFRFLYNKERDLLRIGFNVNEHHADPSDYDLLASEARLASYIAVANGQLPQDHWFAMGRTLTRSANSQALVSWSGSMFEYLMPLLVMPTYDNTLLDETYHAVVRRQIQYGKQRGVPWGVSESSYGLTDANQHYQYQAFGVPGLGLKRGLSEDLVIAPYATTLGLMVLPVQSAINLKTLENEGVLGRFGFFEAVDYTRSRLGRGEKSHAIRVFMSHHSGMSLLSLAYALLDQPMQKRFMANPWMKAAELLLQERAPRDVQPVYPHAIEARKPEVTQDDLLHCEYRMFNTPHTDWPAVHLLSNGRYHVMATNTGSGYSKFNFNAVTRWNEDATADPQGQYCFIRDTATSAVWSNTYQPTRVEPDSYQAVFSQANIEFKRADHGIHTHTRISISPEDDIEVRRIKLTNDSNTVRHIELTSFAEVVLADPNADAAHRAFSNLFIQTQILDDRNAILATRRPRKEGEPTTWMFHQMTVQGHSVGQTSYETDRAAFIGRSQNIQKPAALQNEGPLGNSEGSVLDPVVSIRRTVEIKPDETVTIDIISGAADNAETANELIAKYQDYHFCNRVFEIAPAHSQLTLQNLGASEADAQLFAELASPILYANPAFRARPSVIRANRKGQSALWAYGISGDLPVTLMVVSNQQQAGLIRQAIQAHAYWRSKGLETDLVIINDDYSGYRQDLHEKITQLLHAAPTAELIDQRGGLFLRRGDQIANDDRALLQTIARIELSDSATDLAEQASRQGRAKPAIPNIKPLHAPTPETEIKPPKRNIIFDNGLGGFTPDGREYVTILNPGQATPAPWSNVLANERIGTVISESGSAYTWFENAHEFRLTPWHNDPVTDSCGEATYIRDQETGQFWSPTPLPAKGATPYTCRHGFGYTVFEHDESGIHSELWTYTAQDAPVRFITIKLRNDSGRPRRLSLTGYFEWVLGEHRSKTAMHVVTEVDPKTGAVFARNHYNGDFPGRVAFASVSEPSRTITGDRNEFIGRNGSAANPAAMHRTHLSGRMGAGLDPCAALQANVDLAAGQEREVTFMIGAAVDDNEARHIVSRFLTSSGPRKALDAVWEYWNTTLGSVNIETPDPSINVLANGWLVYQTIASRIWGRSGYYQSGGAYGFRDQLQDCMSLLHSEPAVYRRHLLRAAAHQFVDGDVQHWWHPPTGRGVRTQIRDDYLWLPYAAARFVDGTGDTGVLEEQIPFLTGRPVNEGEESYYDLPQIADGTASLYEHCVRAIEWGLQFGPHGLPLIGAGDWNDGMNEIGMGGTGESVWLGFFLYDVLMQFEPIARKRGDAVFADRCIEQAKRLQSKIEENAWDGDWYRRAYFDDGTPLGSKENDECQIDALPQCWAAITGAVDIERTRTAMQAVDKHLVRRDKGIIQLFDPPFDKSDLEPGYIKGYVPGVRENGGQYTHAAVWTTMGFAALGDTERAWECLRLINPVTHGDTPEKITQYKVEPYVAAADVYGVSPHEGRGGWTWYTGSAGWMYRLIIEQMLGINIHTDTLKFKPCVPPDWCGYTIHYRFRATVYHIAVTAKPNHQNRVTSVIVDKEAQADHTVKLIDDFAEHYVKIMLE